MSLYLCIKKFLVKSRTFLRVDFYKEAKSNHTYSTWYMGRVSETINETGQKQGK